MKKKRGRPKGSKGPAKRYLEYLLNAQEIESDLKLTYIKNGKKKVDHQQFKIQAKIDFGHELLTNLLVRSLKGDNYATRMLLNRRYGRVGLTAEEEDNKTKGLLIQAIKEIYLDPDEDFEDD